MNIKIFATRDDIIRMAREAGWDNYDSQDERLQRFFHLAAAAAELRRLHAENERLAALVCDYAAEEAPDALRTVAADRDRWHTKAQQAEAQRDALLGLLKEARKIIRASSSRNLVKDWDQRTTDAIKAMEDEK